MKVKRVRTISGSSIDPPYNQEWPELKQLQWHAAVVEYDTGMTVQVKPGRCSFGQTVEGAYHVYIGNNHVSHRDFKGAWATIGAVKAIVEQYNCYEQSPKTGPRDHPSYDEGDPLQEVQQDIHEAMEAAFKLGQERPDADLTALSELSHRHRHKIHDVLSKHECSYYFDY